MKHQVGGPQGPPTQQVNVDLSQAVDVGCAQCGCPFFSEVLRMKRLSILVSPTGREEFVPIQTLLCLSCGLEFGAQPKEDEKTEEE